jgi:predicted enzyme involved in methoxymalonyl-ACP biosynthesis
VAIAQDFGTTTIEGEYIPSAKNSLVKNLYSDLGFTEIRENYYQLLVTDFQNRPIFIEEGEIKNEHYK